MSNYAVAPDVDRCFTLLLDPRLPRALNAGEPRAVSRLGLSSEPYGTVTVLEDVRQPVLITATVLYFLSCRESTVRPSEARSTSAREAHPFLTGQPFPTGELPTRGVKFDRRAPLPPAADLATIVRNPGRFRKTRVAVSGCYTVDPYHGAVLYDPDTTNSGISMFGGSDDTGGQDFDWTKQRVCGTFVGVVEWKPTDEPMKFLCPEVCFVAQGTIRSRIENHPF
jgi:hypothetical protein